MPPTPAAARQRPAVVASAATSRPSPVRQPSSPGQLREAREAAAWVMIPIPLSAAESGLVALPVEAMSSVALR